MRHVTVTLKVIQQLQGNKLNNYGVILFSGCNPDPSYMLIRICFHYQNSGRLIHTTQGK